MKIAFFDTRSYDKASFTKANESFNYEINFRDYKLNENTALTAQGYDVVCIFVNDVVNAEVISILKNCGIKLIALRCAGFNNVDLKAAKAAGIKVAAFPLILRMPLPSTELHFCSYLPAIFHRHTFAQKLQTLI